MPAVDVLERVRIALVAASRQLEVGGVHGI
jgi:hypothetical protein